MRVTKTILVSMSSSSDNTIRPAILKHAGSARISFASWFELCSDIPGGSSCGPYFSVHNIVPFQVSRLNSPPNTSARDPEEPHTGQSLLDRYSTGGKYIVVS